MREQSGTRRLNITNLLGLYLLDEDITNEGEDKLTFVLCGETGNLLAVNKSLLFENIIISKDKVLHATSRTSGETFIKQLDEDKLSGCVMTAEYVIRNITDMLLKMKRIEDFSGKK